MECPKCQHENPQGGKFCTECAAAMPVLCPQCGHPNLATSKFCSECAHSLAELTGPVPGIASPSSTSAEGERRRATVLFSDLSGYTALTEKLDPEEAKYLFLED